MVPLIREKNEHFRRELTKPVRATYTHNAYYPQTLCPLSAKCRNRLTNGLLRETLTPSLA